MKCIKTQNTSPNLLLDSAKSLYQTALFLKSSLDFCIQLTSAWQQPIPLNSPASRGSVQGYRELNHVPMATNTHPSPRPVQRHPPGGLTPRELPQLLQQSFLLSTNHLILSKENPCRFVLRKNFFFSWQLYNTYIFTEMDAAHTLSIEGFYRNPLCM